MEQLFPALLDAICSVLALQNPVGYLFGLVCFCILCKAMMILTKR